MHYRIMLNPAARRGRGVQARPAIVRTVMAAGRQFDLIQTTGPGHAVALRETAGSGYDAIVAVGSDGAAYQVDVESNE